MNEYKDYPAIEEYLKDIFLLDRIDYKFREVNFSTYDFNGLKVPRVSNILKTCLDQEFLINWAARVGIKKMESIRNTATIVGSTTHELIENYLLTGKDKDVNELDISPFLLEQVLNSYNNFKKWKLHLEILGCYIEEIIAIEVPVVTPLYGGTIDCIMRINGKVYIVDFKTSKQIDYQYIIQTCSYMWAVNNGYGNNLPHIDGIGIIRVDKYKKNTFEDLFLNEHIPYQRDIINRYYIGFSSMINCYYRQHDMRILFNNEINNDIKTEEILLK